MAVDTVSTNRSFGGVQGVYKHASAVTGTEMTFSVYVPPHAAGAKLPVVWYLSGLTCTHANVTDKGEFRRVCAELGLIFVTPDTSPRGEGVPDDPAGAYDFGLGAGFYVDATEAPFAANYRMWSYITEELPALVAAEFPADMNRQSILGHSMGGHGALTIGLTFPDRYRAISAFAPIVAPGQVPWGHKALGGYLGPRPIRLAQARCGRADRGWRAGEGPAGRSRRGRWFPCRATQAGPARRRLRRCRDRPDLAPASRLRPQLLFHRDLHGRPSALARGAAGMTGNGACFGCAEKPE